MRGGYNLFSINEDIANNSIPHVYILRAENKPLKEDVSMADCLAKIDTLYYEFVESGKLSTIGDCAEFFGDLNY